MAAHWVVAALGVGLLQPGWLHGLAHIGLVFAALGASILFPAYVLSSASKA
jgi:hypothetical protein